ncbi:hypothetical protein AB0H17_27035 [Streptomyces olivoreticuli]
MILNGDTFSAELGYNDLVALESVTGRWGRIFERDRHWTEKTLGEVKAERHARYDLTCEPDAALEPPPAPTVRSGHAATRPLSAARLATTAPTPAPPRA